MTAGAGASKIKEFMSNGNKKRLHFIRKGDSCRGLACHLGCLNNFICDFGRYLAVIPLSSVGVNA